MPLYSTERTAPDATAHAMTGAHDAHQAAHDTPRDTPADAPELPAGVLTTGRGA